MTTNKHNRTVFFVNAGLVALLASFSAQAAPTNPSGMDALSIGDTDDLNGSAVDGFENPEMSTPLGGVNFGYIDIPDIDRGTGNNGPGGGNGPLESSAPSGGTPGLFSGDVPDGLFRPIDVVGDSLDDLLGAGAPAYYAEPVTELNFEAKVAATSVPTAESVAVPAPGAFSFGLLAGGAMLRRRRR